MPARPRRAMMVLLVVLAGSTAGAVEYEDFFFGFGTELLASADPAALSEVGVFPLAEVWRVDAVSFVATYGPAVTRPLRFRVGVGWFPRQPFRVAAGIELPLYERLSRAMGRAFGVYLLGDAAVTVPLGLQAEAALGLLVPFSAIGGVRIGVGIDEQARLVCSVGTSTGAYPIRSSR